jgi:hypothetical protein
MRAVVADVGPQPSGIGLAFGKYRYRGVVTVQAPGPEHMARDEAMQRCQGRRAGTDLVG